MQKKYFILFLLILFLYQPDLSFSGEASGLLSTPIKQMQSIVNYDVHSDDNTQDRIDKKLQARINTIIVGYKEENLQEALSYSSTIEAEFIVSKKRLIDIEPIISQYRADHSGPRTLSDQAVLDKLSKSISIKHKKILNTYVLKIKKDVSIDTVLEKLRENSHVEYAEPNMIYRTNFTPQDELYKEQWAHQNTEAEKAWDITRGSPQVVVAVIDTGVDYQHEDLKHNIWYSAAGEPGQDFVDIDLTQWLAAGYEEVPGEDYFDVDGDPADYNGHGTHCAGIVAASANKVGITGAGHFIKVMPVRTGFNMRRQNRDYGLLELDDVVNGIYYALENKADVISMSFSGRQFSQVLKDVLDLATEKGIVLVAAAGNGASASISYPAGLENVIAVGASDHDDRVTYFSNYGNWVDVSAPGLDILSTVPSIGPSQTPSGYGKMSGTSMSCPYVAGQAGLLLSNNPDLTPSRVKCMIKMGVDPILAPPPQSVASNKYAGTGRVNLLKALSLQLHPDAEPPVARISSPDYLSSVFEDSIDITGTAIGDSYRLEYSNNPYSGQWKLIASGSQVIEGHLGTLNADEIEQSESIFIRLTSQSKNMIDSTQVDVFVFDNGPGWPKNLNGLTVGTPIVMDVDGDFQKEIIAVSFSNPANGRGFVYLFNHDGSLRWAKEYARPLFHNLVAGDIDRDGLVEILLTTTKEILVYKPDGTLMAGWPLKIAAKVIPTLSDINGDGSLEVIVSGWSEGDTLSKVHIFNSNGTPLAGWPVDIGDKLATGGVASVDLDMDGCNEIIFGTYDPALPLAPAACHAQTRLFIYRHNGKSFSAHWPCDLRGQLAYGCPAAGDINNDGQYEIVVKTAGGLFAVNLEGKPVSDQWPIYFEEMMFFPLHMNPVLADLDNDKDLEILYSVGSLTDPKRWKACHHDGTGVAGWPPALDQGMTRNENFNPAAADLDGDGNMEVIALTPNKMVVMSGDGTVVESLSHPLDSHGMTVVSFTAHSPLITDLDNDGKIDVVCTSDFNDLHVFSYEGEYKEKNIEWPGLGYGPHMSNAKPIPYSAHNTFNDWGTGCEEKIILKNKSQDSIQGWTLEFDWAYEITSIWNAKIVSHENNHYVITNEDWNSEIKPGCTLKLGFLAQPGNNAAQKPQNYLLNGQAVQTRYNE